MAPTTFASAGRGSGRGGAGELLRSTREVRLALPCTRWKISRSASQCPTHGVGRSRRAAGRSSAAAGSSGYGACGRSVGAAGAWREGDGDGAPAPGLQGRDELVDGLMGRARHRHRPASDGRRSFRATSSARARRRRSDKAVVPAYLTLPSAPLDGQVLDIQRVVAGIVPLFGGSSWADHAMDGRAMSAELLGDGRSRHLGVEQAENGTALAEIELAVGAGHRATRWATC